MRALVAILLSLAPLGAVAEPVRDGAFTGEFVAARESISPGETIDLALRIVHDDGFHTYWKAPGIVGVPTAIDWTHTSGLKTGDILWPQPQRIKMGPYDALGHEGETFLIVPLSAPGDATPGRVAKLAARVSFMVCPSVLAPGKTCYPGFVDLEFAIPISPEPGGRSKWAEAIAGSRATFPVTNETWEASATRNGDEISLSLRPRAGATLALPEKLYFFSSDGQLNSDVEQTVERGADGSLTIAATASEFGPENPSHLHGILYTDTGLPDGSGAKPVRISAPYRKR